MSACKTPRDGLPSQSKTIGQHGLRGNRRQRSMIRERVGSIANEAKGCLRSSSQLRDIVDTTLVYLLSAVFISKESPSCTDNRVIPLLQRRGRGFACSVPSSQQARGA